MNIGILLALASAVGYGASDFIGGVGARRFSSWQVVVVGQVAGAVVMLVAGSLLPGAPIPTDFAWALLAGVGSATGSIFLFRGLVGGRMGLVAPISAVGAAALPVIAGVAFGARPSWLAWTGILAALPGIWLVSHESSQDRRPRTRAALIDGAIAGLGFGILFVALGQVSDGAGLLPLAANQAMGAVLTVIAAAVLGQPWRPYPGVLGWGTASGLLGALSTLAFMAATGAISLAITGVLASLYPNVTVVLAALFLRERVGVRQVAGIAVCTVAIAAMAIG